MSLGKLKTSTKRKKVLKIIPVKILKENVNFFTECIYVFHNNITSSKKISSTNLSVDLESVIIRMIGNGKMETVNNNGAYSR